MDEGELLDLAGRRVFDRGADYYDEGRVELSRADEQVCEGRVQGSARYRVTLRRSKRGYDWDCDCPYAEDGSFCKHLVAAALAWRETRNETPATTGKGGTDLQEQLQRLPAAQLADWLHEAALDDPALARRLQVRLARDDPAELQAALDALLRVRGFLDYRRSMEYARQLDEPLQSLLSLVERDPDTALALAARALKRLFGILERADDSAGVLQDRVAELADLHARAATRADIDPRRFARALHGLKKRDEWDFLPLAGYQDALGERGWATYRARVEKEYAALPPRTQSRGRGDPDAWSAEFPILHRREELAHCEGDCDVLIEVFSRDTDSGYACQRIVEVCRAYGREAEAMRWAERGVREHPDWPGMRELLAQGYLEAGLGEEALEQAWQAFLARPNETTWTSLRRVAGEEWTRVRAEALAELAAREPKDANGASEDVTLRARLLEVDGDFEAAAELVLHHPALASVLEGIAEGIAAERPGDAARLLQRVAEFELRPTDARGYPGIVRRLRRILALAPSAEVRDWIAAIRQRYKARRKLMRLLDEAGL